MSRLTVRLPESVHQYLAHLAKHQGVSLNEYIVEILTEQVILKSSFKIIPEEEINEQQQNFQALLEELGQAPLAEAKAILAQRETVQPEEELSAEVIARLRRRINNTAQI